MDGSIPVAAILDSFGLTGEQRQATAERQRDVIVTAGAGSGKTRTLVARYISLLAEGYAPRRVAAITFTEKAAREMRTRVRMALRELSLTDADEPQSFWAEIEAQMDSARIGTIHSLCAEVLRAHPAEAGLDPDFGVAEESETVRLRKAAVEAALLWAVEQPEMRPLFESFTINRLEKLLRMLLEKRLEVTPESLDPSAGLAAIAGKLQHFLQQAEVRSILAGFQRASLDGSLAADAGETLADQIVRLLDFFTAADQAFIRGNPLAAAVSLWQARRSAMALNVGKRNSSNKGALRELRDLYDVHLLPWLKGDDPPGEGPDALLNDLSLLLGAVYARALGAYTGALRERQALDFDDLEAEALHLLRQPVVAAHWQAELAAVLVDEFQDTNERQRELVYLLCGDQSGKLFVVGDARQSIYRFRGADVTVFTRVQRDIQQRGGRILDLDRTFRAHAGLLESAGGLLAAVMGDRPDPERPYRVPFSPLVPDRTSPGEGVQAPYLECVLGAGEDAESGRRAAARALAQRLLEMRDSGEIGSWDAVALLFRASSGFPYYEEAFEAVGIPYVTVAGSGFYDRPEIRDLINLLRALSDPWNDQALAGFLRSPAIGLSDPGLYHLRCQDGAFQVLRKVLEGDAGHLCEADQLAVRRALAVLQAFEPLVDRLPVSELLRRLVARLDTLAVLAVSRSRLWRNANKLLADARRSGLVRVRAFLEYIDALRDVGVREGEALSEIEGAVRLMTIHKAKGLQFPIVVLADAARRPPGGKEAAYRLAGSDAQASACWAAAPDRVKSAPLAFRLAAYLEEQQAEAENARLLYVAMTRAQEKLLISGHLTIKADGNWQSSGWLQALIEAGGADVARCLAQPGVAFSCPLPGGGNWRLWACPGDRAVRVAATLAAPPAWPASHAASLVAPLVPTPPELRELQLEVALEWSITTRHAPPIVIGDLVHEVLRRWPLDLPGSPALEAFLQRRARQAGISASEPLEDALRVSRILLARIQRHPLWREIQSAAEWYRAVPFQAREGTAYIDLLYRVGTVWKLVDFHTGSLIGEAALRLAVEARRPGLVEKGRAVAGRLGANPQCVICFLDVDHRVVVQPVAIG